MSDEAKPCDECGSTVFHLKQVQGTTTEICPICEMRRERELRAAAQRLGITLATNNHHTE